MLILVIRDMLNNQFSINAVFYHVSGSVSFKSPISYQDTFADG